MRQFLFPRRPLSRRTLLSCHLMLQITLLVVAVAWLAPRTPWLADTTWAEAWPPLVLGIAVTLLGMAGLRLVVELALLPHYLAAQRDGFAPSAVITRSFDRRPAVHDTQDSWISGQRREDDDAVLGEARVTQPATPMMRRRNKAEPTLDFTSTTTRQEPQL
ncbi:hypothetical protein [Litchfieldella xinjiangensis]|uniref:hypothetical protein n=1 Tax=Litchfieldella xinjiangensis TaxID=1166948 RepID=UPI0005BAC3FA|nr:hypothetical protein [Halomonas xinjiangensis]